MKTIKYLSVILLIAGFISCSIEREYSIKKAESYCITIDETFDSNQYAKAQEVLMQYCDHIHLINNDTIGYSDVIMTNKGRENLLCNFSADALKEYASNLFNSTDIDICILNSGGFRSDMPKGHITLGDIYKIYPFDNVVELVMLKGSDINELFEGFVKRDHFEAFSGAKVTVKDMKLLELYIGNEPIDNDKIYNVVTIDYVAAGNDKMDPFERKISSNSSMVPLRDAIVQYIKDKSLEGKHLNSKIDGRICFK